MAKFPRHPKSRPQKNRFIHLQGILEPRSLQNWVWILHFLLHSLEHCTQPLSSSMYTPWVGFNLLGKNKRNSTYCFFKTNESQGCGGEKFKVREVSPKCPKQFWFRNCRKKLPRYDIITEISPTNQIDLAIWMFPKISGSPNHPFLIGFSIIFTTHLGVPLFLETFPGADFEWGFFRCWTGVTRVGLNDMNVMKNTR